MPDMESSEGDSDSSSSSKKAKQRRNKRLRERDDTRQLYMGNMRKASKCWFMTCWFGNVPVEALVDTGAEASVISSRMFRQLDLKSHSKLIPSNTQFRGIGGDQRSLGTALFQFLAGDKIPTRIESEMHIIDLPHIDMILGMDTFASKLVTFHMSEGTLQFPDGEPIQLKRRGEADSTQVHTMGPIKIKAKQARFISAAPIYGDTWIQSLSECLVEPMDHVFERTGLLAGTTLIDKCKPAIRVYVMNTTEHDVEIGKGMPIAKVSCVSHVSSHDSTDFVEMHNLCMTRLDQCRQHENDDIGEVAEERYQEFTDDLVSIHTVYEPPK